MAVAVLASELQLANGDKITGSVVSETAETITFKSPILGEFTVTRDQAKIIPDEEDPGIESNTIVFEE